MNYEALRPSPRIAIFSALWGFDLLAPRARGHIEPSVQRSQFAYSSRLF